MFRFPRLIQTLTVGTAAALLAAALPATALAKTYTVDCTKNGKLQATIDSAADGDVIEITGICMANILIRDKGLTLVGAASPGPHGITGVAANTDAVSIQHSRGTHLEGLTISNPHFAGIRIRFFSSVTMTDCEVSNSGSALPPPGATGIWVQETSTLNGTRLTLDDNLRGLGAAQQSRAFCRECDLNDNVQWAASAVQNSAISLLDSAVTGLRGIQATEQSYIDIDCISHDSTHPCSLDAGAVAGTAQWQSTVVFYEAGDFNGRVQVNDRSKASLYGARQQAITGNNGIGDESSLDVGPGDTGESRLMGSTNINGFSHAQFYGAGTDLDGSLNCGAGGDAWVEPGVDLTNFTITGCDHAPTPCVPTDDVEYIISGGPEPDAGIYVDDILEVFGEVFPIAQVGQGGGCCQAAAPIRFRGNTGEEIRVVARDGNNCYSLRALYLQKADGTCLTQLSDDIVGPNCGSEPPEQTFFDQTFDLP
jgi:hypothetical protein